MKKVIVISGFLLLFITLSNAQDVRFGIKGGVNLSNVESDTFDNEQLTSFHLGGFMEALYENKIAIQPEILYSEQGFLTEGANVQTNYKLGYINVPVMVKYYAIKGFFVEAGPQMGFLNTAKIITELDGNSNTEDIKKALRANDFCLNVGVAYQLIKGWNISARYNWGISNIAMEQLNQNLKNRVLQVSIGYMF